MEFKNWLIEGRGQYNPNNTIVVDIQPEYSPGINFPIHEFSNFLTQMLEKGRKVLYFYNGDSIGSQDTADRIKQWLVYDGEMMEYGYDDDEYDDFYEKKWELFNQIAFYDKGYSFFRGWMDSGVDDAEVIRAIRTLVMRRAYDSREIDEEEWEQLFPDAPDEPIYLPHIDILHLRQFNNGFICGGGRNECLKEVQLLMNALNIKYRVMSQFVYG